MQCCITGPAFEYLLQQPNQALVQAVMLNSVAFTRMRSHQKGQLMDLLGRKGLHQMLNGQRQHILVRSFMLDQFLFLPACLSAACLSAGLSLRLLVCMSIRLFVCMLPACLRVCLCVSLATCQLVPGSRTPWQLQVGTALTHILLHRSQR